VRDKPNTPMNCELDWLVHAAACTRQRQTLDCKRWTSLLSAVKGEVGLHTAGEVWYLILPCWYWDGWPFRAGIPPWYVTNHPGQLSLLPCVCMR